MSDTHIWAAKLIDDYNRCFVQRDLHALHRLYVSEGPFTYFDNHADCDSTELEDHLQKVETFFQSGVDISGLDTELVSVSINGHVACITATNRYRGKPDAPPVRVTLVAEQIESEWKIRHLHYSNQPL